MRYKVCLEWKPGRHRFSGRHPQRNRNAGVKTGVDGTPQGCESEEYMFIMFYH